MNRPKKENIKVKYINGVAEMCSIVKQYSIEQDKYIDYLESNVLKLNKANVSGSLPLFTKDQVYRIIANFALSVNTEAFCGGHGTTTQITEELKKYDYVDFIGTEKGQ